SVNRRDPREDTGIHRGADLVPVKGARRNPFITSSWPLYSSRAPPAWPPAHRARGPSAATSCRAPPDGEEAGGERPPLVRPAGAGRAIMLLAYRADHDRAEPGDPSGERTHASHHSACLEPVGGPGPGGAALRAPHAADGTLPGGGSGYARRPERRP